MGSVKVSTPTLSVAAISAVSTGAAAGLRDAGGASLHATGGRSGARPIGDRLARQIEHHGGKPAGWLDEAREPTGLTHAEQQFLALALKTYRGTNSDGRKRLRQVLRDFPRTPGR